MSDRKSLLELDARNVFVDAIGTEHGLTREHLEGLAGAIGRHAQEIEGRRGRDLGFMELPYNDELAATIKQKAEELRGWCKNFVVLGIGGSALGNIAVHGALNHPFHNLLPAGHKARLGAPRVFVLDNVDPALMAAFMDTVEDELDATVFNVITKSGSTAETMSQFLHARDVLKRRGWTRRARSSPPPTRSRRRACCAASSTRRATSACRCRPTWAAASAC